MCEKTYILKKFRKIENEEKMKKDDDIDFFTHFKKN